MLKGFDQFGFKLDYCLGEYHISLDENEVSGLASLVTGRLALMISGEPSGERRKVMIEALSSIVPEGESVEYTPRGSSKAVVFTSPKGVQRDVNLGLITESSETVKPVTFKVVGLRVLNVVVEAQHDYDDCYALEDTRYELLLQSGATYGATKAILTLGTSHGMCGSGYTSASWSEQNLREVTELGPMTHKPLGTFTVDVVRGTRLSETFGNRWQDEGGSEILGWSGDGGCGYYPSGSGWVKVEGNFLPTGRGHEKPLIHVFMGGSNLGKSTLGSALSGSTVYETDKSVGFEDEMAYAQVIILGNKWSDEQSLDKVKAFFVEKKLDVELVPVQFGEPCLKKTTVKCPNARRDSPDKCDCISETCIGNGGSVCWCGCGETR